MRREDGSVAITNTRGLPTSSTNWGPGVYYKRSPILACPRQKRPSPITPQGDPRLPGQVLGRILVRVLELSKEVYWKQRARLRRRHYLPGPTH